METFETELADGPLAGLRWGDGPNVAVALHGITANAMSWRAVGEQMPADWSLVAIDLRGRGRSRDLPGRYGYEQLADDIGAVIEATGAQTLVGHSLGAYLALATRWRHPSLTGRLVLIDGGLALPVPEDADPDEVLAATIGPALGRLSQTWPDVASYVDFFRSHPAMGPYWSADIAAYAEYDALVDGDVVRARAVIEAVRTSARELIVERELIEQALASLDQPTDLLVAERGMFDQPGGLMPEELIKQAIERQPLLRLTRVADTNHYTIVVGRAAAAVVAATIASGS